MKFQPNRNYKSNDNVNTPPELCERIIKHFKPNWSILEPCCGSGNFCKALISFYSEPNMMNLVAGDIENGHDFLGDWGKDLLLATKKFDWIVTNPPWSKVRPFLQQSMRLADNIVFLITVNHIFTKARLRDVREANFGIKEILFLDTPKEFPASGFQLGAVHLKYRYTGDCKFSS